MDDRTSDTRRRLTLLPATDRRVLAIAAPIILSNLSVPLLGAVDTAVMGHLGDAAYIGAVALGGLIFSYLYWGFGFLRMGTTGLAAQALGARDPLEALAVAGRAGLIGLVIGLAIVALQAPIRLAAFGIMDASARTEELASIYFHIRVWSAPAVLIGYAQLGWFLAQARTRTVMAIQIFTNAVNIALNFLFVAGLGMQVEGVALATLIAEYLGAVMGLVVMLRIVGPDWRQITLQRLFDVARLKRLVSVNADIMVRSLALLTAFAWFTNQGAKMGDTVLAANAALQVFLSFLAYGLDGFAFAAEALVGGATGGGDRPAFRAAALSTTRLALVTAVLSAVVLAAGGRLFINILTNIEEVRAVAAIYLPWLIALPLIAVWSYQADGIFMGATETRPMRNMMLLSLALYIALSIPAIRLWGNHGLWAAFSLFMALRAVTLGFCYPRLERRIGA
ncbi:MATE family efflux transporter [Radicibacter daui]|uniref:MATE family efflux transporter n=1 Tax=Radicibacter daui TaxID=3064829 RepID=UPI004046B738